MSEATVTSPVTNLSPGFRFHPTDEELVCYFLKRKVCNKKFQLDVIAEIDIYKFEPWDLPGLSLLKTRDLVWYFFSTLDKKYGSVSRTNRITQQGYWRTTGKDRPIQRNVRTVGMKRTLVFYIGRTPHGERTNWVMHEYRLEDSELVEAGVLQDAYVVCKVFEKSGSGPKNGEQYGAPFVEEEWDDDILSPQGETGNEDSFDAGEPSYILPINRELTPELSVTYGNAAPVIGFNWPDSGNSTVGLLEGVHAQRLLDGMDEDPNRMELHDNQQLFSNMGENTILLEEHGDQDFFDSMDKPIYSPEVSLTYSQFNDENHLEMDDAVNDKEVDCSSGEGVNSHLKYNDSSAAFEDGSFLEVNDLLNPVKAGSSGLDVDELLMHFPATDDNLDYEALGSCEQLNEDAYTSDQANLAVEAEGVIAESNPPCQQAAEAPDSEGASSSGHKLVPSDGSRDENNNFKATNVATGSDVKSEGDSNKSLWFSSLLESIPSPPAFAAEYSLNGSVESIKQNSANTSSSIHVNAEAFFMSKLMVTDSTKHWLVKKGDVRFLLSYAMRRGDLEPLAEIPSKATSAMLRNGFCVCFWFLILAASFKIGSYFYARPHKWGYSSNFHSNPPKNYSSMKT